MINAKTDVYGIFGNPVGHSLSPLIHNTLFEEFKINAVYAAFEVQPIFLGLAFEAIRALGLKGVNLTIPHKEAAIGFVDEIPEDIDRCIGALNTVVNKNGKLYGYNTDGKGFLTALHEELSFNPEGKTVLVLGAGGAARGVAFSAAHAHADRILIYNRTSERAVGLSGYLQGHFPETEIEVAENLEALKKEKIDLVVNATSCGMAPPPDLSAKGGLIAKQSLKSGGGVQARDQAINLRILKIPCAVYDLVYAPLETALLAQARSLGLPCANGFGMLAAQAAFSFELWTGKREGVRERMLEALKQCRF